VPDTTITSHAYKVCGIPGYAPYGLPGSSTLGHSIASVFKGHSGCRAVILENHGVVVGGADLDDSFQCFETLENTARTLINTQKTGKPLRLSKQQLNASGFHLGNTVRVCKRYSPSLRERKYKKEMVRFIRRAYRQGLMTSTQGTLSIRLDDNGFLISPSAISRWEIQPGDIITVSDDTTLNDEHGDHYIHFHNEIYNNCSHVNAILQVQPPNLMAFAVTGAPFDTRTIPESWIFLQDVPYLPSVLQDNGYEKAARIFNAEISAAFMLNDSFVMTGSSIMDVFDKVEIAEFTAQSIIMAKDMGRIMPITDEQIDELRLEFLS
jgi:L-fuculose-phosphate aldolase